MDYLMELGYLGLFLGSFLASTVIPLSSELILSGLIAAKFDLWTCIFVATLGNFLGGMTSYGLGYLGKWEWIEKYMKISKEKIENFQQKVAKYGIYAALFAWLPMVGDLIAIGFGFMKISPLKIAILMLLGRFARFVVTGLALSGLINNIFC